MMQRNAEIEQVAKDVGAELELSALDAGMELELLELSAVQTESLWTSILYAYIRDQSLIRYYNLRCESSENRNCELEDIFQPNFAECFRLSLDHYGLNKDIPALFYSGEGDFIAQIARLFLLCRQKKESIALDYDKINADIAQLNLTNFKADKGDYIKCFRDAIAHFNFKIDINDNDPEMTTVTFLDVLPGTKRVTGKAVLTNNELSSIMKVVVNAVCERLRTQYGN